MKKTNKYIRAYINFNRIRISVVLLSIIYMFIKVGLVESDKSSPKSLISALFLVIVVNVLVFLFEKFIFKYIDIPGFNYGVNVIKESDSFMKNVSKDNPEDLGHVEGLLRGYSFEYRTENKISYTKTKLFDEDIENTGYKEFLDELYKVYGYYPTGRVVFRGYWIHNGDDSFSKIKYNEEFLIDTRRNPILRKSRIMLYDDNGRVYDEGIVTNIELGRVFYKSKDGNPREIKVTPDRVTVV